MAAHEHHHEHQHGHAHLGEAEWAAMAAKTELEGEVLLPFVTSAAAWVAELRGTEAPPVRRVLDIGSGPGVGSCELARCFPDAQVVAVDGSPGMLERAAHRVARFGLEGRVTTHVAELPDGLDPLEPADVIWASMSLHHVGDEVEALRLLGGLLAPGGLLAIAEVADPMRWLPDDLDVGDPGLADRLQDAEATWFASMRAGLAGSTPSEDLEAMVSAAGLEVVDSRIVREHQDAPLDDAGRRFVRSRVGRARDALDDGLTAADKAALDVLADDTDPRSVLHRDDVFIDASRRIVIARAPTA